MTLDEAIEINEQERRDHHSLSTDVIGQAQALLIEAGKRVKWHKEQHIAGFYELLPGETTE